MELPILVYFGLNMLAATLPLFPVVGLGILFVWLVRGVAGAPVSVVLLLAPGVVLGLYLLYLFLLAFLTKTQIEHWNKVSPPEEGEYDREFTADGVADERIYYYHLRGFVIKFPLWLFIKSPFPWMVTWLLRKATHQAMGKGIIMENSWPSLEFTTVGDRVYMAPGSMLSSHVVDSIFGKLTLAAIHIGADATIQPNTAIGPGSTVRATETVLPNSVFIKYWHGKEGVRYHSGTPARPFLAYTGITGHEQELGVGGGAASEGSTTTTSREARES